MATPLFIQRRRPFTLFEGWTFVLITIGLLVAAAVIASVAEDIRKPTPVYIVNSPVPLTQSNQLITKNECTAMGGKVIFGPLGGSGCTASQNQLGLVSDSGGFEGLAGCCKEK